MSALCFKTLLREARCRMPAALFGGLMPPIIETEKVITGGRGIYLTGGAMWMRYAVPRRLQRRIDPDGRGLVWWIRVCCQQGCGVIASKRLRDAVNHCLCLLADSLGKVGGCGVIEVAPLRHCLPFCCCYCGEQRGRCYHDELQLKVHEGDLLPYQWQD